MCKFCHEKLPDWRETLFQDVVGGRSSDDLTATTSGTKRRSMDEDRPRRSSTGTMRMQEIQDIENASSDDVDSEVRGDIIVKFNNISFQCQVRTGPEGLADFMRQIRDKCGIPEEKMKSLNLTYRCKDPSNGMPMTLEGLNESAFDAAVLCSAVQDKMKHDARASHPRSPGSSSSEITSRSSRRRSGDQNSFEEGRRGDVSAFRRYE